MEALTNLLTRVTRIDPNKLINDALDTKLQDFIIQLNTEGQNTSQLFKLHIDSNGDPLFSQRFGRGEYSALTERITNGGKRQGDQYTLKDTGDFYKSFKISTEKEAIVISANPLKSGEQGTVDLLEDFGQDILGLTDPNTQLLINELIPKLKSTLLEQIQA